MADVLACSWVSLSAMVLLGRIVVVVEGSKKVSRLVTCDRFCSVVFHHRCGRLNTPLAAWHEADVDTTIADVN